MRWLWVVAGVLLALPASAREAKDYKASETSIVNCIEAAEAALLRMGTDITRQCIGRETQNCMSSTEDTYQPHKRMFCASAEAEVWFKLMQDAFAALIARYTKDDAEQSKVQTSVEYEPVVPALKQAHDAWEQGKDCEFARIQAGIGTDRIDAPARCGRDQAAARALTYRRWLRGQPY
jgi:hypothetical protein